MPAAVRLELELEHIEVRFAAVVIIGLEDIAAVLEAVAVAIAVGLELI